MSAPVAPWQPAGGCLPGPRHRQHAHPPRLASGPRSRPHADTVSLPNHSPPTNGCTRSGLVADLAAQVVIVHAAPGSKTEAFARKLAASSKPLLTVDSPANTNLAEMGAEAFDPARNLTELISHGT